MQMRLSEKWAWPGAVVLGLALVPAATADLAHLARGGLAAVAVAVAVAAFVALPTAIRGWSDGALASADRGPRGAARRVADALADLWSLLLVAAIVAPLLARGDWITWLGAPLLWGAAALAAARARSVAAPALGLLALVALLGDAAFAVSQAPPWTLLVPHWDTWSTWLPGAVLTGFLLAAAGLGQWSGLPGPAPGRRRLPWAVAGLALLGLLAASVAAAARFEASAGQVAAGALTPVLQGLVGLAAATAVLSRRSLNERAGPHAVVGFLATLWFAGPAREALPVFWNTLLPVGMALVALALAERAHGAARAAPSVAALALVGVAAAAWPGVPDSPVPAAAAAALVVLAVWVAGTRAVLGGRPA